MSEIEIKIKEEKTGLIYMAINKINGKKYVGQTMQTLEKRMKSHIKSSKRKKIRGNMVFHKALFKYGIDSFEWMVLNDKCRIEEIDYLEKKFIKDNNSKIPLGYNVSEGGQRERTIPKEVREKISKSLKGRKISEEHKKILIASNIGRKCSEKSKKMMSESKIKKNSEKNPDIYKSKDWLYDKYIVEGYSTTDIAKLLKSNCSTVNRQLKRFNIRIRKSGNCEIHSREKYLNSIKKRNENRLYFNKDWLYSKYVEKNMSILNIAKEIKVSSPTISKYLKFFKISKKHKNEKINIEKYWLYEKYIVERKSSFEISKILKVHKKTILNYLKRFNINVRKNINKNSILESI